MADDSKKTECIKVWLSEPLELALRRLADQDDRKLSEYICIILRHHVYGYGAPATGEPEGPKRGD